VTIPIRIAGAVGGAVLPTTGADVAGLSAWGAALLVLGYVLVWSSRRRLHPATGGPMTFILPEPGESTYVEPLFLPAPRLGPAQRHVCEADILDLPG
jgi:LPXTG-motif cell wall-anchored protein